MKNWSVYLLTCADDSLYCGVTTDFKTRLAKHNQGIASKYTRARLPVECAALRGRLTKTEAYQLEYRIKKVPKNKKIRMLETWRPAP